MFSSIFKDTMVTDNWQQVQRAGEEKQPVLFPLGVIEEHGPHLPLGADIYWSAAMCRLVKERLGALGQKCVIGAPYYWGVNYCTGGFPGSFSLKPETMQQVLFEIFENLKDFGFSEIYCFSYHGDSFPVRAIAESFLPGTGEPGACQGVKVFVVKQRRNEKMAAGWGVHQRGGTSWIRRESGGIPGGKQACGRDACLTIGRYCNADLEERTR